MHVPRLPARPARPGGPRRFAMLLALVALVALTSCQAPAWSQLRAGPGQTGAVLGETRVGSTTIASLTRQFIVTLSSPWGVISNGSRLFGRERGAGGHALVFSADAAGHAGCAGSPVVCQPLWTAPLDGASGWTAVSATTMFTIGGPTPAAAQVVAFDAAGTTNCSGTPRTCQPLWSTTDTDATSATLAGDRLYVIDSGSALKVYDATGSTNCSGTPKRCAPLWSAAVTTIDVAPAIVGGHVTVLTPTGTATYDAAGVDHCTGTPTVCAPQWTTRLTGGIAATDVAPQSLAVTGGQVVTVRHQAGTAPALLQVTDAGGSIGCAGTPVVCDPLWSANLAGATAGVPAIEGGRIVVAALDGYNRTIESFDLHGADGCAPTGFGTVCQPQWSSPVYYTIAAGDAVATNDLVLTNLETIDPSQESAHYSVEANLITTGAAVWSSSQKYTDALSAIVSDGHLLLTFPNRVLVLG